MFNFSKTKLRDSYTAATPGQVEVDPDRILIDSGPSERGWHRLETFLRCPQLYSYKYNIPEEAQLDDDKTALVRGSLIHVGVAHYYARRGATQRKKHGKSQDGVIWYEDHRDSEGNLIKDERGHAIYTKHRITDHERFYEPLDAMALAADRWAAEGSKIAHKLLPLTQDAVEHYIKHWRGTSSDRFDVVGVEFPMRTKIFGTRLFTCRADLGIRNRQGVYIVDHKSSSAPTAAKTLMRYALSGQIHGLHGFGRMHWGKEYKGVIINIIGARAPFKMRRERPPAAPAMTARFPQIILDTEAAIEALTDRDPWKWPVAANEFVCMTPYGKCPAWDLCAWGNRKR